MYESFLQTISRKQWKRVGLKRRAGVLVPLFSVYSKRSIGLGELYDLTLLVDWCKKTGMSMIQLLPLNDVGFHFSPYDAQSGFALEPMYLSLDHLCQAATKSFRGEIESLRKNFQPGISTKVDYRIKAAKLELLWKIFKKSMAKIPPQFSKYVRDHQFWLRDYVLFKVIKEENGNGTWETWSAPLRNKDAGAVEQFEKAHQERIRFREWLQWQLFEQFKQVRTYVRSKKVFLMGDLPFSPSRDSADVWSYPEYFKLDLASGAPPDAYFFNGQRWGMPPCNWEKVGEDSHRYLIERLKYAQNFYDLLRVDHVVGLFRIWTIPVSEPFENGGLNGVFDPSDERLWEKQGRKLLSLAVQNTKMLMTGEDLGTVPECSFRVLEEFAIPGADVQRWMRDPQNGYTFKAPTAYRKNSTAILSTHDMTPFNAWWEYEAGTVYGPLLKRKCEAKGISFEEIRSKLFNVEKSSHDQLRWKEEISDTSIFIGVLNRSEAEVEDLIDLYRYSYHEKMKFWSYLGLSGAFEEKSSQRLVRAALEKMSQAVSIFSVQLIHDWLALGDILKGDSWETRINAPGIARENNWSFVMPLSLEKMKMLVINREIKAINRKGGRV